MRNQMMARAPTQANLPVSLPFPCDSQSIPIHFPSIMLNGFIKTEALTIHLDGLVHGSYTAKIVKPRE
jgi:hypothetical protein